MEEIDNIEQFRYWLDEVHDVAHAIDNNIFIEDFYDDGITYFEAVFEVIGNQLLLKNEVIAKIQNNDIIELKKYTDERL